MQRVRGGIYSELMLRGKPSFLGVQSPTKAQHFPRASIPDPIGLQLLPVFPRTFCKLCQPPTTSPLLGDPLTLASCLYRGLICYSHALGLSPACPQVAPDGSIWERGLGLLTVALQSPLCPFPCLLDTCIAGLLLQAHHSASATGGQQSGTGKFTSATMCWGI